MGGAVEAATKIATSYFSSFSVWGFIGNILLSAALSFVAGKLMGQETPSATSFVAQARNLRRVIRAPTEARRIIYGEVRTSGVMVFAETSSNYELLYMVIALADHECYSIGDVYIGEKLSTSSKLKGTVNIGKHLGSDDQEASSYLISRLPDKWTSDHRLRGITYLRVMLQWDQDVYYGGIPNIMAVVKGKNNIYDYRTETYGYTNNWALCVLDYLTLSDGMNAGLDEISYPAAIAAANVSNEDVLLTDDTTEKRYTCNGTIVLDKKPSAIIQGLLSAGAGALPYIQGLFTIHAGVYKAPVIEITESHLRGDIEVTTRFPRSELFNAVKGVFANKDNKHDLQDFPPVTNSTYEDQDGERIIRSIELPYTDSIHTAQRIAKIILEKSRQGIVVACPLNLMGLQITVMDTVMLTMPLLGWNRKVFRVTEWSLSNDGGVDVICQEEAAASYDWVSGDETVLDPAPDTFLPDPFTVGTPGNLQCFSGSSHLASLNEGSVISRIYVTWDELDNAFVNKYIVEYKLDADSVYSRLSPVEGETHAYITPVTDGALYNVRVKGVNSVGVSGAWPSPVDHTVIGKEADPNNGVIGFAVERLADGTRKFEWSETTPDADVRAGGGYVIRYKSGSTSDWDVMTALHQGVLTNSPHETNELLAGTYTFAIKTKDSSGNLSTSAIFLDSVTLGDPRFKEVLYSRYDHSENWPGTLTDCWNYDGVLIADADTGIDISDLPTAISSLASTIEGMIDNADPIIYETPEIDISTDKSFTPLISSIEQGTATYKMKTGTDADGSVVGSWVAVTAVTAKRYAQFQVTVTHATMAKLQALTVLLDGEAVVDVFEDVVTSTESGSWFVRTAAGHIKVGSRSGEHASISQAIITALQNTGGGWSWELISKSVTVNGQPGAEFKIYNASQVLSDATIDVELRGPKT